MKIDWLFEIEGYKWSTKKTTFSSQTYSAKIIPKSFNGIQMRWDIGGTGLISPSDLDFEVENTDLAISRAQLEGKSCTIKLVIDNLLARQWKLKIQRATIAYQVVRVYCVDLLQAVLEGEYPNTPHPREQWVSINHEPEDGEHDNYRIPVIFGEAYIPLMYIYNVFDSTGYYVLGKDIDYDIIEVKSPPEAGKLVWDNSYTFTQTSDSGYRLSEFIIAPTETQGVYSPGVWASHLKPLVRYKKTSGSTTNPSAILSSILQEFGVAPEDIDTSVTWSSASSLFTTRGIEWNGGIYESRDRESVLRELASLCDSTFYISDKIELHPFSKTSVETIDTSKTKKLSLRLSRSTYSYNDGGHLTWAEAGYPQNNLMGKAKVPTIPGQPVSNPTKETLSCRYIGDSITAQKLGILYFQRKLTQQDTVSFETSGTVLDSIQTIKPADVITLNDAKLGETRDMILSSVHIKPDLSVSMSGITYARIDDFDSISAADIAIEENPTNPTLRVSKDLLRLKASGLIFKFDSEGNPYPPDQVITFTAESWVVGGGNFKFVTSPYVKMQEGPENVFTLSIIEFGNNEYVQVTVQQDFLIDYETVFRVEDGSGVSGKTVTLTSENNVFRYDSDGLNPDPASTIVTATAFNLNETATISYNFYLNWTPIQSGALLTYTYTPQANRENMPQSLMIEVTEDGVVVAVDQIFMIGIMDGEPGLDAGNWSSTLKFSSDQFNRVNWTAGILYSPGAFYLINSGTTGLMLTDTTYYIYFDPELSPVLQITTAAVEVVGSGHILVAVAKSQPEADAAFFQAFGGAGGLLIAGENIVGNTITGNHFVANLITTSKIRSPIDPETGLSSLLIDFDNAAIVVNNPEGMIVDAAGGVKVTQNSSIGFADGAGDMKWQMVPTFLYGYYHGLEIKPIGTSYLTGLSIGSDALPITVMHTYVDNLATTHVGNSSYTFREEGFLPAHDMWPDEPAPSLGSPSYPWGELYAKLEHNHMWSGKFKRDIRGPTHPCDTNLQDGNVCVCRFAI
jgi:hypothetical protein